jgi:hypothetical protein
MIEVFEFGLRKEYHVASFGPTVVGGYYLRSSKALLEVGADNPCAYDTNVL